MALRAQFCRQGAAPPSRLWHKAWGQVQQCPHHPAGWSCCCGWRCRVLGRAGGGDSAHRQATWGAWAGRCLQETGGSSSAFSYVCRHERRPCERRMPRPVHGAGTGMRGAGAAHPHRHGACWGLRCWARGLHAPPRAAPACGGGAAAPQLPAPHRQAAADAAGCAGAWWGCRLARRCDGPPLPPPCRAWRHVGHPYPLGPAGAPGAQARCRLSAPITTAHAVSRRQRPGGAVRQAPLPPAASPRLAEATHQVFRCRHVADLKLLRGEGAHAPPELRAPGAARGGGGMAWVTSGSQRGACWQGAAANKAGIQKGRGASAGSWALTPRPNWLELRG